MTDAGAFALFLCAVNVGFIAHEPGSWINWVALVLLLPRPIIDILRAARKSE